MTHPDMSMDEVGELVGVIVVLGVVVWLDEGVLAVVVPQAARVATAAAAIASRPNKPWDMSVPFVTPSITVTAVCQIDAAHDRLVARVFSLLSGSRRRNPSGRVPGRR
jgi:hypothetical protein